MAIIFEEALKKNIQKDKLLPVYILFGDDGYLKKFYTEKISKQIAEPDDVFNYCRFDSCCNLQDVYDFAMQQPLMADRKYAELCDFDFEQCSKSDFDKLCELLSEVPDSCTLVLRFDSLDFDSKKSSKFKKLVSLAEKNGGVCARLDHRSLPELVKMLEEGAKKRGSSFSTGAAKYLVQTAGDDINLLRLELSKLCAFSKDKPITQETVDNVCVKTVEASVYNLSKFIMACDTSAALSCLDELFFTRVEPMAILYSVSSAFCDLYRIFAARQSGENIGAVAQAFPSAYKGKEFLLEKAQQNIKKFDKIKLHYCLEALYDADNSLKSFGADARIVLEQLIVRLIYIIAKGEKVD